MRFLHETNEVMICSGNSANNDAGELSVICARRLALKSEQFVKEVVEFSSQYGNDHNISYTASNVIGQPEIYPRHGDFTMGYVLRHYGRFWMELPSAPKPFKCALPPECKKRSQDFIEVKFEKAVYPLELCIYETYNPGAVVRILAFDPESNRWKVLWYDTPEQLGPGPVIFSPFLRRTDFATNYFRIEFHHEHLDYSYEIDAIKLVGSSIPPVKQLPLSRVPSAFKLEEKLKQMKLTGNEEEATDNGYFHQIPGEVVHLILSHLDLISLCRVAQVCKLLHIHAYDPTLYTELDLQPCWEKVTSKTLTSLQERCSSLQHLSLSWCGGQGRIKPAEFVQFFQLHGTFLTILRVSNCPLINDISLEIICRLCPNLEEFILRSCRQLDRGFLHISELKNLQKLDLYRTHINPDMLIMIVRSCLKLEHLLVGSCISLSRDFMPVAKAIAKYLKNLKTLDVWRLKGFFAECLSEISQNCPLLQELEAGWCYYMYTSSGCIGELVQNCPNLIKLGLTAVRTLSDNDLTMIALYCKDLQQLEILGTREVTAEAVERVIVQCEKLRFLDVSFCNQIRSDVVQQWRTEFPHVSIKQSFQST